MSQRMWNTDHGPLRGFYRDRESAWIFGVCSGIADRFNFRVATVRVIAILCLLVFFWMTVAVYVAATLLVREKPLIYAGGRTEYEFWRRTDRNNWSRS